MANLLQEGTYSDGLRIIGTRLEPHKVEGEPKIVIVLAEPDTDPSETDFPKISDYLYTSNDAWDAVTAKRLTAYGWDPAANNYDLAQLADPNNALIGTVVAPVILKTETYTKRDGSTGSSIKVYRVGDEKFGSQIGDAEAKAITASFQNRMKLRQAAKGAAAINALPQAPPTPPAAAKADEVVPF